MVAPDRLATDVGMGRDVVVPSPSPPKVFSPQHFAVPPALRVTQVREKPAPMVVAPDTPSAVTGMARLFSYSPSASWPLELLPQHFTVPSFSTAQA